MLRERRSERVADGAGMIVLSFKPTEGERTASEWLFGKGAFAGRAAVLFADGLGLD